MSASAISIYQRLLDDMGEALLKRDAKTFLRHIFLPHAIQTEDNLIEFDTIETAQTHFYGFTNALAGQNVDAYIRIARDARFEGETRILGKHDCFITSCGKLVVPKFANSMVLELRDGIWGATRSRHHARYVSWPDILPRFESDP